MNQAAQQKMTMMTTASSLLQKRVFPRPGSFGSSLRALGAVGLLALSVEVMHGQNAQFLPVVTTVAGTGTPGSAGNGVAATSAQISAATDAATTDEFGNIYISDTSNNIVRRVDAVSGIIMTVAGGATVICANPVSSPNNITTGDGCPATQATLVAPKAVRFYQGNMYIDDSGDNLIRVVSGTTGIITTYAGNKQAAVPAPGMTAINSPVRSPQDIIFDPYGDLFVIIAGGTPSVIAVNAVTKIVTIVAGNGTPGKSGDGGPATAAMLSAPFGLAFDSALNLFISEGNANDVRKVVFPGGITTQAGLASGIINTYAGGGPTDGTTAGYTGLGGPSNLALLNSPQHIFIDASNNLYIADRANNRIVVVTPPVAGSPYGISNNLAGSGLSPTGTGDGGPALLATLGGPLDVELTAAGDVLITDSNDARIRAVQPTGMFGSTAIGTPLTQTVYVKVNTALTVGSFGVPSGYPDFSAATSPNCPAGTAVVAGTNCTIVVTFSPVLGGRRSAPLNFTDSGGNQFSESLVGLGVAPITALLPGTISTTAGTGLPGNTGDMGSPTKATLNSPTRVAIDGQGNQYIADSLNNEVREIGAVSGTITRVAGTGTAGFSGDAGAANLAQLSAPSDVAVDGAGNLYIADTGNNRIRLITAATGIITTFAGTTSAGFSGDGGLANAAQLTAPKGIALTPGGLLLIADTGNNVVRAVGLRSGQITTFAGGGTGPFSGDGGPAVVAGLSAPTAVAVDTKNVVYVSDTGNQRVRQIANDLISTLAGTGTAGFNGDGAAASTQLNNPSGLVADAASDVFVADASNNRVREISNGQVTTVVGTGTAGYTGDGGSSINAAINGPKGVTLDGKGNLVLAGTGNNVIRTVNVSAAAIQFPATSPGSNSAASTVLLSNIGNAPLTIASVTFPAPFVDNAAGMPTDCAGGNIVVASAANCQISVVFGPATPKQYSGTVTATDNSQGVAVATQTVAVSGTSAYVFSASATLPKTATAGTNVSFVLTVTNPQAIYTGTVHLTSSDGKAILPANYTFLASENGVHTFTVQLQTAGTQTVTATDTSNASVTATASTSVVAGVAASLVAISGGGQSATIQTAFKSNLVVEAFDAFGNPASGTAVTFTAPSTGVSATFSGSTTATVTTGVSGTATSPLLTANAFAGTYAVQATAPGVTTPVSFSLTNTSTTAASFTLSSSPPTVTVNPGGSGTVSILAQGFGGLNAAIQLSCSTSNPAITCSLNPASVLPSGSGGAVSTTLTVMSTSHAGLFGHDRETFVLAFLPLGLLVFATRRRRLLSRWPVLGTLLIAAAALSGCGSQDIAGSGASTVTVTGSSGTATASTTVICYVTGYPAGK
jgi:hypothetical protein